MPSSARRPRRRCALRADKFQLLGRVDRRIVASGEGRLQLEAGKIALDGKFKVDEGLIDFTRGDAPALSDDVIVIRPQTGADGKVVVKARQGNAPPQPPPPPKQSAAARALALDLRVDLGNELRLKGRGLDTRLARRTAHHVARRQAGGQRHRVDRRRHLQGLRTEPEDRAAGMVIFTGAVDNPRLDIEATRPDVDVRVGVQVSGTASNPRIRLFSEPEMSEIDKLSWLVLGRATEGLGRAETALLQRAAFALLAGDGESTTDKVSRALGLDEFSLRQTDGEVKRDRHQPRQADLEPRLCRLRARPERDRRQLAADLSHRAALHAARAGRVREFARPDLDLALELIRAGPEVVSLGRPRARARIQRYAGRRSSMDRTGTS